MRISINGQLNSNQNSKIYIFKIIRVKKWCKICRKSERDHRKEYYRHLEEEKQREFERLQQRLFEEAKEGSNDIEDYHHTHDMHTNFLNYIVADESEEIEIND